MRWLKDWQDRRRRDQLARRIEAARRAGHGVHVQEWRFEAQSNGASPAGHDGHAVEERVTAWCREVLTRCRRPWGIDLFDLTVAWAEGDGERPHKVQIRRLRPSDLYGPEPLAAQLRSLLHGSDAPAARAQGGAIHVVAALFSWGDAIHAAIPVAS